MRKPKNTTTAEVKAAIRRDIAEAPWRPGTLLPTRPEMVDRYGASTHTIGKALRELEAEGIVIIRPSVGTLVAPNSDTGSQLIARASTGRIYPPGQFARFTFCGMDVPPDEVAEAFDLGDGETAIVRRRQRVGGELVLSQSESWYHARHATAAPLLLEAQRITEGSFMYLMRQTGLRAGFEDSWIVSRPANDAEKGALTLDESKLVLVERTIILNDAEDEYIEYGISSRPGHVPYPVKVRVPLNIP